MFTLAENGLQVYVVAIPQGKDPDEFLSNNPPEKFEELLASAKPLVLMHLDSLKPALRNNKTRREALASLFEGLSRLNLDDVLQYMGSICDATVMTPEVVNSYLLKDGKHKPESRPHIPKAPLMNYAYEVEAGMCALLMRSPDGRFSLSLDEAMNILKSETARETAAAILTENPDGLEALWLNAGDTEKVGLLKLGENFCAQINVPSDAERFVKVYSSLKNGSIERRIAEIKSMPPDEQNFDELIALYIQRMKFPK